MTKQELEKNRLDALAKRLRERRERGEAKLKSLLETELDDGPNVVVLSIKSTQTLDEQRESFSRLRRTIAGWKK